jgi:hypothetical protein
MSLLISLGQPFALGQKFQFKYDATVYMCIVQSLTNYNQLIEEHGLLTSTSDIELVSKSNDLSFVGKGRSTSSHVCLGDLINFFLLKFYSLKL